MLLTVNQYFHTNFNNCRLQTLLGKIQNPRDIYKLLTCSGRNLAAQASVETRARSSALKVPHGCSCNVVLLSFLR